MTPWHTLKNRKDKKRKEKKERRIEKRNEREEFENIRKIKSDEKKCEIQLGIIFMQVWTEIEEIEEIEKLEDKWCDKEIDR